MRKLFFLPLLTLVLACTDSTLIEPQIEDELDLMVTAKNAGRTQYVVQLVQDLDCEDCPPLDVRYTPGGPVHFSNGTNGFFVTGELEGYALITGGVNLGNFNFDTGKGTGSGKVHVDLTEPGIGAFDCHWHAKWEHYGPAWNWAYVEYGKWFNCEGSGDFEGMQMTLWNGNSLNQGQAINDGIAEIW